MGSRERYQVVVASGEPLMLGAVCGLLEAFGVGAWGDASAATAIGRAAVGSVALVDSAQLGMQLDAVVHLTERAGCWLVAFRGSGDLDELEAVMRAGGRGYLLRAATEQEMLDGVSRVLAGSREIPADLRGALTERLLAPSAAPAVLTRREREVLGLAARGETTADIARMLLVSHSTAKTHLQNAYGKLGVRNRSAAIAQLAASGLLVSLMSTAT
jgi:DNA-binding NarL/FixJ family response regulator